MPIFRAVCCLTALLGMTTVALAQTEEKPIRVAELLKIHKSGAANFDKQFKDTTIFVEGAVSDASFMPDFDGKVWLHVSDGNTLMLAEYNDGLKGLRINHKVTLQGVAHSPTSSTVKLRNAKVVKVLQNDYPPSKEVVEEIAKLQGVWRVKLMTTRGKKVEGWDKVSFVNHQIHLHQKDQMLMFGLAIAPKRKEFDMHGRGSPVPGIYRFEGDELKLCIPENPKMLPPIRAMDFNTTGRLYHVLVLQKN